MVDLKNIKVFLILSIIIGFVHIYPDVKFICKQGDEFKGITLNAAHDSIVYLGRINSIYKGDKKAIAGIDIFEHKDDPWVLPFIPELVLGTIGSTLQIPLNYFKIVLTFFLPVINFWLIYYFAFLVGNSKSAAIVSAFAATLGYSFFAGDPLYIYNLLFNKDTAIQLWFLRTISPQFNYILLLISWIFLFRFIRNKSYFHSVLSGVSIGLYFYIGGIYYLTYFTVFVGLILISALMLRNYIQLKRISIMIPIVFFMAIPFAINQYNLVFLPEYSYLMDRLAIIYGRVPIIPVGITVVSVLISWFHYSRKTEYAKFIILFVLTGFICLNQQLITGKTSQPSHWQNYMVKTFVIIVLFPTIALFFKEKKYFLNKKHILTRIAVVTFIVLAMIQQENYYQRFEGKFAQMQTLAGPLKWLKNNSNRDDVLLNDPMNLQNSFIPYQGDVLMYGSNYVYLPSDISTLVSLEEVEYRYLSALRFFDYSLEEAETLFTYWNGIYFRGMVAELSFGGSSMPADYLAHLKNKYMVFLEEDSIKLISKNRVDYVILERSNPFYSKIDVVYKTLPKVYDDGQFKIYKIPNNNIYRGNIENASSGSI